MNEVEYLQKAVEMVKALKERLWKTMVEAESACQAATLHGYLEAGLFNAKNKAKEEK